MDYNVIETAMKYTQYGAKGAFLMNKELFDSGYYNKMLKNIGLSMEYEEDDLEILDDYFRNKRNMEPSQVEFMSRIIFGIYIAKIFETNNTDAIWKILEDSEKPLEGEGCRLAIMLKGTDMNFSLFPLVKLGKIIENKEEDSLFNWYSMAVVSGGFLKAKHLFN